MVSWPTSASTGCGCRRGARRASPRTGVNNCAPSASTSRASLRPAHRTDPMSRWVGYNRPYVPLGRLRWALASVLGRCVMKNPAAGGGRWVDVPPERLVSWIATFNQRHGDGSVARDEVGVTVTFAAADGAVAECHPPFPPLR